tara:strand:+ start:1034 stop:1267 length:234 start_codon:yes stop_codon:yes gene_type:complete
MVETLWNRVGLASLLIQYGEVFLPESHSLLQEHTSMRLFNDVSAQLQNILGDEDHALNMATEESGFLITLKLDDEAD